MHRDKWDAVCETPCIYVKYIIEAIMYTVISERTLRTVTDVAAPQLFGSRVKRTNNVKTLTYLCRVIFAIQLRNIKLSPKHLLLRWRLRWL